ncbi:hypothetical protein [Deinococcus sp. QL22]|uniref:hypothetical protein n=1 Tax=Deinococcus sp. QL22 TaxID=2939437 RepID=UPI00201817CB|nr:hypothetical protein [Deinococcus sp. QL22]UQN09408.1 hypothetical protein M1R55_22900 [Deinococcus sp. QL22]
MTPQKQPAPTSTLQPSCPLALPYQPPHVQDLGPWQVVTLVQSVGLGPGGLSLPGLNPDRQMF